MSGWIGGGRRVIAVGVVCSASVALSSTGTTAQDPVVSCITCQSPPAVYRCEVLPPEQGVMAQSPQIFCAGELAQANGHARCLIVRAQGASCDGQSVTLAYTGPVTAAETPTDNADAEPVEPADTTAPPKTLIEATDRAVTSTGRQLKQAGDAVSDATKKTGKTLKDTSQTIGETVSDAAKTGWRCVTSLFQSC
ncbi:MAG: hypothetical protein AAGJ70_06230 [Pseudomonadota bacterium]